MQSICLLQYSGISKICTQTLISYKYEIESALEIQCSCINHKLREADNPAIITFRSISEGENIICSGNTEFSLVLKTPTGKPMIKSKNKFQLSRCRFHHRNRFTTCKHCRWLQISIQGMCLFRVCVPNVLCLLFPTNQCICKIDNLQLTSHLTVSS